jgi:two-component system OmpR family response regulator
LPQKTRPRVLCVDDDEDSRVMLVTLLKHAFIEAKAVGTAAQTLSLIQAEHFDLYTLDGWLPEIDGFELCRRLRVFDSHTPILFFSGAAYEADKKKGIEAGADDYVIKPNISQLVRSIKQFMSREVQQPVGRQIGPWAEVLTLRPARNSSTLGQLRPQMTLDNLPGVLEPRLIC